MSVEKSVYSCPEWPKANAIIKGWDAIIVWMGLTVHTFGWSPLKEIHCCSCLHTRQVTQLCEDWPYCFASEGQTVWEGDLRSWISMIGQLQVRTRTHPKAYTELIIVSPCRLEVETCLENSIFFEGIGFSDETCRGKKRNKRRGPFSGGFLCQRGGPWEEEEEEKIPPVPPGYRGMKDGEMERRRDV